MTIKALQGLWQQAFGDPEEFIDGFFRVGFCPERCRTIEADGRLAAALYWFDCLWEGRKVAYIYGVATDKDLRGQGLCRQLMEQTHKQLQQQGYAGAALVPAAEGLAEMYGKMGYRSFCSMETKVILPAEQPAAIEKIIAAQYGVERQKFLPPQSVVQDDVALRFYGTYGGFYRFAGGVFCTAQEGDTLYIQEYLGNTRQLPGIVTALGCSSAQVRLPGGDKPFAMYRSFTKEEKMPAYLGLALD